MTLETEKNLNEAIDWLQQTGGSIQNFAAEQAPLYCREVVAWEFLAGVTGVIAGLFILIISTFLAREGMKIHIRNEGKSYFDKEDVSSWVIPAKIGGFIGLVMVGLSSVTAVKAHVAPRIIIVEHLRGISK